MNINLKKALLAGTAIVAVGALTPMAAKAAAVVPAAGTTTLTGADTWDIDAGVGATTADITYNGAGAVSLTVTSAGGVKAAADLGDITVTSVAGANTLVVGDGIKAVTLTLNGDVAGDVAANDLAITIDAANAGAASATLVVMGDLDLGTGTVSLDSDADGTATITFAGTGAQDIEGIINGQAAGDGVVNVTNTGGTVTFNSNVGSGTAIGALNIGGAAATTATVNFSGSVLLSGAGLGSGDILIGATDGADSVVTFNNTVTAGGANINLGAVGATVDAHTLNFVSTTNNVVVTGAIAGLSANDVNTLNITGIAGKAVTFATAMGANIDDINIGAAATLNNTGGGAITAATIDLGAAAELNITQAATITGDINGNGTLDIDVATTWVGDIGDVNDLTALEILTGKVLTIDAATAAEAITVDATTITLEGAAAGITVAQGAQNVTFAADIDTAANGAGAIIVGDGAGTVSFQSLGASTLLDLASLVVTDGAGVQNVDVNGDHFVVATTINTSDTLRFLGTSGTVSGTIIGGAAGRGAIVVGDGTDASDYTFDGAIGGTAVGSFTVKTLSTANITTTLATKSGGVGVDVDAGATMNVDTDLGVVAISDANGDIDFDGTVGFTGAANATVTASSDIFIDGDSTFSTALDTTKTLTLTATAGDVGIGNTGDTIINVGNNIIIAAGDDLLIGGNTTDTVTLNINHTAAFDPDATEVITNGATGAFNLDSDTDFRVALLYGSLGLEDGDTVTVINGAVNAELDGVAKTYAQMIASGDVVLVGTGLIDIQDNGSDAQDLLVKAVFRDADDVVGDSQAGAAQALMDFAAATDELSEARGNLLTAPDAAAANEIAEALGPAVDGGNVVGAQIFSSQLSGATTTRLAMLRDGSGPATGMAAGELASGSSWWVQGFGTTANQDERDGVDGYDALSLGVAIGGDTENLGDNTTVGVAFSYANVDVESDDATDTETDIDAFQLALYGDYDIDSRTYVAGQVGYIWGNNDTTRHNVGGVSGTTASGDYDSDQLNVRAELGRDFMSNEARITPKVVADYIYYSADNYTETGAGTANLNVDQDTVNVFNVGVGADASWSIKHSDGSFCEPALHALVKYDLANDGIESTNSFTGGGAAFQTDGADPARAALDLGADLTYHTTANWDLKAGYNFEIKEDFMSHSGLVRAAYKF